MSSIQIQDFTPFFLQARYQGTAEQWRLTPCILANILQELAQDFPGATFDWDEGAGEEWATIGVLCQSTSRVLGYLRADMPLVVLHQELVESCFKEKMTQSFVIASVADFTARHYSLAENQLGLLFPGRQWSSQIDPHQFCINELWWTTI